MSVRHKTLEWNKNGTFSNPSILGAFEIELNKFCDGSTDQENPYFLTLWRNSIIVNRWLCKSTDEAKQTAQSYLDAKMQEFAQ